MSGRCPNARKLNSATDKVFASAAGISDSDAERSLTAGSALRSRPVSSLAAGMRCVTDCGGEYNDSLYRKPHAKTHRPSSSSPKPSARRLEPPQDTEESLRLAEMESVGINAVWS